MGRVVCFRSHEIQHRNGIIALATTPGISIAAACIVDGDWTLDEEMMTKTYKKPNQINKRELKTIAARRTYTTSGSIQSRMRAVMWLHFVHLPIPWARTFVQTLIHTFCIQLEGRVESDRVGIWLLMFYCTGQKWCKVCIITNELKLNWNEATYELENQNEMKLK